MNNMGQSVNQPETKDAGPEPAEQTHFLYRVTGQTPWWIVSVVLHGLIITLAGLFTAAYEFSEPEVTITTTQIFAPAKEKSAEADSILDIKTLDKPNLKDNRDRFDGPASTVKFSVTDEMMKLAELSDRNTTKNGDIDDNGMMGDPKASLVYLESGANGKVGGGGNEGIGLNDDLVGMSGTGSRGENGGYGGGKNGGIGKGDGTGVAGFGNGRRGSNKLRLLRDCGGDPHELVLAGALQWLAYHQEPDGHWDTRKLGANVKTDTAITSLALLAFLGAGHTEKVGQYKEIVTRSVAWLKSKQDASGLIWDTTDDGARHRAKGYPGAIATLAMAEAAGMANIKETKEAAQRAINYCIDQHQNGDGSEKLGWRYGPKEAGDLSVTGWYIMALKSAKVAGLHVSAQSIDGALRFLDSVEHRDANATGPYGAPSQFWYTTGEEHAASGHRLTAIGALARAFTGSPRTALAPTVEWLVNKGGVPDYGANGEKVDLYYWYYGSMCVFQQGPESMLWKHWNAGMKKALSENQCKQGEDLGSWNPVGEFSGEWGRAGQTALSALCMEVYYRYELLEK